MSMTSNRIDPITATYISPEDLEALANKCTAAGDYAVMQSRSDVAAIFHDAALAVEALEEQSHHLRLPFTSSTPPADQLIATEHSIEDFQAA